MLKLLWPNPAAMIKTPKTKTLLIADPHIGWEIELQEKGIHVPSQTPKLLVKLTALIARYKPTQLVILGDVKYTVPLANWASGMIFQTSLPNCLGSLAILPL